MSETTPSSPNSVVTSSGGLDAAVALCRALSTIIAPPSENEVEEERAARELDDGRERAVPSEHPLDRELPAE